jgi:hypothetical protein
MSPKDSFLDFLNLTFTLILIAFCIIYFIAGDHFAIFTSFLKSMVPLALFGIIFLIRLKLTKQEVRVRRSKGNTEIVLNLNVLHKLISEVIVFGSPILLGLLVYLVNRTINNTDVIFIAIVFLIMFFWQRYLFSKEK